MHCRANLLWVKDIRGDTQYQKKNWISEERLDIREETNWNKVLFSFQQGQTANISSLALFALRKQISGQLLAFGSIVKIVLTWLTFIYFVFPHIFLIPFVYFIHLVYLIYLVYLVNFIYFVYFIDFIHLVYLVYIIYIIYPPFSNGHAPVIIYEKYHN